MSRIQDMFMPLFTKSTKVNDGNKRKSMKNKPQNTSNDDDLINYTVGLVSASKYKEIKDNLEILRLEKLRDENNNDRVNKTEKVVKKRVLSFAEDDIAHSKTAVTISKDPTTCTSFLKVNNTLI